MSNVYVLTDDRFRIIRCEGGYTVGNIDNLSDWVLIDTGEGDTYNLCQSHYFKGGLFTEDGIPRYRLEDNLPVLRSEAEIEADRAKIPEPETPPTVESLAAENERLSALLEYVAMMADIDIEEV